MGADSNECTIVASSSVTGAEIQVGRSVFLSYLFSVFNFLTTKLGLLYLQQLVRQRTIVYSIW